MKYREREREKERDTRYYAMKTHIEFRVKVVASTVSSTCSRGCLRGEVHAVGCFVCIVLSPDRVQKPHTRTFQDCLKENVSAAAVSHACIQERLSCTTPAGTPRTMAE